MSLYSLRDFGVEIDGQYLVEGVNIDVEPGKCTAIIGASGSEKA